MEDLVELGIWKRTNENSFNSSPTFANSVDPDQLASEEAKWSGSALFVVKYVNLYQQPGSSNLTSWKWEADLAS